MPEWVVGRVAEALHARQKPIHGSRVLVVGLAYKADVDDLRESPSFALLDLLQRRGASVAYYDPHIPVIRPTREHGDWTGTKSIEWSEKSVRTFDAALISTAHKAVNYQELADWCDCIVDTRNAMAAVKTRPNTVWKA
jgi:UDP-N-acetyl-D-glucosamine dehydrogenase